MKIPPIDEIVCKYPMPDKERDKRLTDAVNAFVKQQQRERKRAQKLYVEHFGPFGGIEKFNDCFICQCESEEYFIKHLLDGLPKLAGNYIFIDGFVFSTDRQIYK